MPEATFVGSGGSETKGAVGATALIFSNDNATTAQIQDGVNLYADDLRVNAANQVLDVDLGASGGQAKNDAGNGVVTYNSVGDTTLAQIGARATVVIGSSHVVIPSTNPNPFASQATTFTDTGVSTTALAGVAVPLSATVACPPATLA